MAPSIESLSAISSSTIALPGPSSPTTCLVSEARVAWRGST